MVAVLKVKAIETSISACFKLKQELGSYALMGDLDEVKRVGRGCLFCAETVWVWHVWKWILRFPSGGLSKKPKKSQPIVSSGGTGFEKLDYLQCCCAHFSMFCFFWSFFLVLRTI